MLNPFHCGNAVLPNNFIVPDITILDNIIGRLTNSNHEGTLIVGEPRFGKTSLLQYIMGSSETIARINNCEPDWKHIFQFVDIQMFGIAKSQEDFWKYSLAPVLEFIHLPNNENLLNAYHICQNEGFDNFNVENLLDEMENRKLYLILIIDEFDVLLSHPNLGTNDFFANLRSLATRIKSLTLIAASRLSISELQTQLNSGSPYFNYLHEIILGQWTKDAALTLLERGDEKFSLVDKKFLVRLAGRHPYFLQLASYTLWDTYRKGIKESNDRLTLVWKALCGQAPGILNKTWESWPLQTKQIYTTIAHNDMQRILGLNTFSDMPHIFGTNTFDMVTLYEDLRKFPEEISFLYNRGFVTQTASKKIIISSQVMSWWLTTKLVASINSKDEIGKWLIGEQKYGIFKRKQSDQLLKWGTSLVTLLNEKDVFLKVLFTIIK